jgi:hypothetical protein
VLEGCRCANRVDVLESSLFAHSRQLVVWLDFVVCRAGIPHDLGIHRRVSAASNREGSSLGKFDTV